MLEEGGAQAPTLLLCNLSLLVALLPSWLTKKTQTQHHLCKDPTALTTRVCVTVIVCVTRPYISHNKYTLYLRGMKREEWVAPTPGRPWEMGL